MNPELSGCCLKIEEFVLRMQYYQNVSHYDIEIEIIVWVFHMTSYSIPMLECLPNKKIFMHDK